MMDFDFDVSIKIRCVFRRSYDFFRPGMFVASATVGRFAAGHPLVSSDGSGAGGRSLSAGSQPGPSSPGGGVPGDLRDRDGAGEKWSAWAEPNWSRG